MAEITASMVKELRDKTGAGMMDAKTALTENNGNMENAIDWLRKKGLAKAAKKSGRTAAEGLVALSVEDTKGTVVEVNSETDFVARNAEFQDFVVNAAKLALKARDIEDLKRQPYGNGKTVEETLTNLIATIGENMTLRRMETVSVSRGVVSSYIHNALAPNLGKIGVLVGLESATASPDTLQTLGRQIAMHVAAANPEYLSIKNIDPDALDRERAVLLEKHKASGKPADKIDQIVEGDLRKNYYGQVCLLEQTFVMDGKTRVADVVANAGKDITLTSYTRVELGAGIEKEETDFAAEVAAAVNS